MFPFLPSLPNNTQGCSGLPPQQMMLPNPQQQVCNPCSQPNPVGFSSMQQIQSQLHTHHQFQSPKMAAFGNQNMDNACGSSMVMPNCLQLTPSPSLACALNIPFAVQTSLMGMQPQQGHPCLHQNPQNLNQIAVLPFHGQICNVPQSLNQLGVPQINGQFGIGGQMQSVNQVCPFPQGNQLWPQNLLQNLNQIMGLHGPLCSQNAIQMLNQIQQLSQHTTGTAQPGPFNVPQSSLPVAAVHGSQNTFLSNSCWGPKSTDNGFGNALISTDPTKGKGQGQDTSINLAIASQNAAQRSLAATQTPSSFAAVSTKINDTLKILPSDSVQPGQNAAQRSLAAMQTPTSSFAAVSTKINDTLKILPSVSVQPGQNAAQRSFVAMQTPTSSFAAVSTKINDTLKILPSDSVQPSQVSHTEHGKNDVSAAKFGNSACRNFNRNHHVFVKRDQSHERNFNRNRHGFVKRDQSHGRFQKPSHHIATAGSFPRKWGKGPQDARERKTHLTKDENRRPDRSQRRAVTLKYTEEEIKKWCEARKRNFPTAANIERKKHESNGNREAINENAKMCRQQLKEVLAKQMELGFEAAEVPPHCLSDAENIPWERNGKKESRIAGRFPGKYGKRGRQGSEKWQTKRQKSSDEASPVPLQRKREPTLLQKLLSSEIKRDRSRLLQVFRFMTLNSFFEHWPDKPLEYPQVSVKDLGCIVDCAQGKSSHGEGIITVSGVGENFRASEVHGQAEPSAGDEGESADESICVNDRDGQGEDEGAVVL